MIPQCPLSQIVYQNEDQLAEQLVGFLQQFLDVFSELKGKNFYTTGESVSLRSCFQRVAANIMGKVCWDIRSLSGIWIHASIFVTLRSLIDIANYIYENPGALDLDLKGF